MGLVTNIVDFTPGTPIFASEVNGNFDNIVQVVNGGLDDHNVAGFTAAVIVAGEFDLDRIPVLSVDKIPQLPGDRVSTGWGDVSGKPAQATRWPTWGEVTGKPSSFPPSSHTHSWGEVTGKPSSFPPSSHTHSWADVTGKPAQATRWPTWSEVSGKPSSFTPSSHSHSLSSSSITGTLPVSKGGTGQTSLTSGSYLRGNGTSAVSLRTPSQVRGDIGAAASSHTHSGTDITSGTIPAARMHSSVVLTNNTQNISGQKTFSYVRVVDTLRIPVRN